MLTGSPLYIFYSHNFFNSLISTLLCSLFSLLSFTSLAVFSILFVTSCKFVFIFVLVYFFPLLLSWVPQVCISSPPTSSFKYCTSTCWDLLVGAIASLSCCHCFSFDVKVFVHSFYLLHDNISLVSVDHLLIHFVAPFLLLFLIVLLYRHCFSSFLITYYW